MEVEKVEQEAPEETKEPTAFEVFTEKLQTLKDKDETPAEVEAQADADVEEKGEAPAEETKAEAEPKPRKVEGPSIAMKAMAKREGVPDDIIAIADSDEHLDTFIKHYTQLRAEEQAKQAEAEKEKPFTLSLPEDDFDNDDPVRKQFSEVVNHFEGKLASVYNYLGQLADIAIKTEEAVKSATEEKVFDEQGAFDDFIDELESPVLGNRRGDAIPSAGQKMRQAIYWQYKELEAEHPRTSKAKLMAQAAEEFGFTSKQAQRQNAIVESNSRRLGGGSSKPLPEAKLEGKELALAKIKEALSHNK